MCVCVCVCVCVVIPFILDIKFVDVPAGVTQEEGHTGFLHLPSAVLALIFLARRIQSFLSLVDREVEFCVLPGNNLIVLHLLGFYYLLFFSRGKIPVRVTTPRFELTSQCQRASRLPTEPPERSLCCIFFCFKPGTNWTRRVHNTPQSRRVAIKKQQH